MRSTGLRLSHDIMGTSLSIITLVILKMQVQLAVNGIFLDVLNMTHITRSVSSDVHVTRCLTTRS